MADYSAPLRYRAHALETAACLWEAVLTIIDTDEYTSDNAERKALGDQVRACREAMGTSHLRLTVIGWTDHVDEAWRIADGDDAMNNSGQYGECFDWDFVPHWIVNNIDWSVPHMPTYRPSAHTLQGAI